MFGPKCADWEQLYDFKTQSYFYRHKLTGEFSRTHRFQSSADTAPISTLPLWEFKIDFRTSDTRDVYWHDLETGFVTFLRPLVGTFLDEQPMSDFRRFNSSYHRAAAAAMAKQQRESNYYRSTASTSAAAAVEHEVDADTLRRRHVQADDDFAIVHGAQQLDVDFEKLFSEANPDNFDPELRMQAVAAASNGQAPPAVRSVRMRRMETRDGGETPAFPVLDEHVIEKKSVQYSDNPMFNPTVYSSEVELAPRSSVHSLNRLGSKRSSRWGM